MPILCINTATHESSIALISTGADGDAGAVSGSSGVIVSSRSWIANRNESEKLLPSIVELVPDLKKLDGVFVVKGPGPFTALRVGIVTANTIVQNSSNLPMYSLDTFDLLLIGAVADFIVLNGGGNAIIAKKPSGDPEIYLIEDFVKKFGGRGVILLHDLNELQFEKLMDHFEMRKNPLNFAEICTKIDSSKCRVQDLPLMPYYLKEPEIAKSPATR